MWSSSLQCCIFFRFADVFGLDLADVKTFLDEIPKVPKSAFQDLKDAELSDLESDGSGSSERTFPVHPPSAPPTVAVTSLSKSRDTLVTLSIGMVDILFSKIESYLITVLLH